MTDTTISSSAQPAFDLGEIEFDDARKAALLRQRAKMLASRATASDGSVHFVRALTVRCDSELYGLPLEALGSVFTLNNYAWIPGTPPLLLGVSSDRGELVGVYDLRQLLDRSGESAATPAQAIYLRHSHRRIAIAVERVEGTADIAPQSLRALELDKASSTSLIRGVDPDGLILLDVEAIVDRINQSGDLQL